MSLMSPRVKLLMLLVLDSRGRLPPHLAPWHSCHAPLRRLHVPVVVVVRGTRHHSACPGHGTCPQSLCDTNHVSSISLTTCPGAGIRTWKGLASENRDNLIRVVPSDKTWRHQSALCGAYYLAEPDTSRDDSHSADLAKTRGGDTAELTSVILLQILFSQDSLDDTDSLLAVMSMWDWEAICDKFYLSDKTTSSDHLNTYVTDSHKFNLKTLTAHFA